MRGGGGGGGGGELSYNFSVKNYLCSSQLLGKGTVATPFFTLWL